MFILFSCDDEIKFDNPLDEHNQTAQSDAGQLGGECYRNKTCNEGLTCDEKNNTCIEELRNTSDDDKTDTALTNDEEPVDDSYSETTPDDADSIDDSGDPKPDENNSDNDSADSVPDDDSDSTDSKPDESDSIPDEDTDTDSGDSTTDNDVDTSDTTTSDEDADTIEEPDETVLPDNDPTIPCNPNPCSGIANSTGVCTISGTGYVCGCQSGYNWNNSNKTCDAAKQEADCSPKPANSVWNNSGTEGRFIQTWNGSGWTPASYTSTYSATSGICTFTCESDYHWENNQCGSNSRTDVACTGKPTNASWNTTARIDQTWNGSSWQPSSTAQYSEEASETECRFKCNEHYDWNYSSKACDAATQKEDCSPKLENTVWNDSGANGKFTQTWNGEEWEPASYESIYSETAGLCTFKCDDTHYWYNSECTSPCDHEPCEENETTTDICEAISWQDYSCKCKNGYFWNGENCVNPCDTNPCSDLINSTEICSAVSWQDYVCGCNSGYFWNGSECKKQITLGNICTGQDKCYDNSSSITCPTSSSADFYGQDTQYRNKCTAQSFTVKTVLGGNIIIDNNTGLTWEATPSSSTYTWNDAPNYCAELNNSNYGGKNDWRVPNPLEFMAIVDNSTSNPATNSNFLLTVSDLWTSQEYNSNTSYAYISDMYRGYYSVWDSEAYLKTQRRNVLCVSGNEIQPAVLSDFDPSEPSLSDKIVTDKRTGLMWQKDVATSKTWKEALIYCQNLNSERYGGYSTGWRLPNKNELLSLINYEKSETPYSYFPDMPIKVFWSSSTTVYYPYYAFLVNFGNGYVSSYNKFFEYGVMCVRN